MPRRVVPILPGAARILAQARRDRGGREDERAGVGDLQSLGRDRDALRRERLDLARAPRDRAPRPLPITDSVPATIPRAAATACRPVADDERVAGIVAALEAATTSARLESQSTILPLPSSPHWPPITVTFAKAFFSLMLSGKIRWRSSGRPPARSSERVNVVSGS
jgi:hypothetical protein